MTPAALAQNFSFLVDAPGSAAKLRELVSLLAVRGKLVPQDPHDEPASVLQSRIERDARARKATGEIGEPRNSLNVTPVALPFRIPASWGWVRLIEVANVMYGFAFESRRFTEDGVGMPLIRIRDISSSDTEAYYDGDYDPQYLVRHGDYLIGMDGEFNVRRWGGPDALLNQRVARINNWRYGLQSEFLVIPLQFILKHLHGQTSLVTVKHLSAKQLNGILLPLPPIAEQKRIVARTDELMKQCDELEALKRRQAKELVIANEACLHRLTSLDGEPTAAAWPRVRSNFDELYDCPDTIPALRQSILELAVQGKLVPQDAKDEPASELLRRARVQRDGLVGSSEIRKPKPLPSIGDDDGPVFLPKSWERDRLGNCALLITKGSTPTTYGYQFQDEGIPFVKVENVKHGRIIKASIRHFISAAANDSQRRSRLEAGDILFSIAGTIGETCVVQACDVPANTNQALAIIRGTDACFNASFLKIQLDSFVAQAVRDRARGGAMNNVSLGDLRDLVVLIPPMAEQARIVAKVRELMALCDELEEKLNRADAEAEKLLAAVVHHMTEAS